VVGTAARDDGSVEIADTMLRREWRCETGGLEDSDTGGVHVHSVSVRPAAGDFRGHGVRSADEGAIEVRAGYAGDAEVAESKRGGGVGRGAARPDSSRCEEQLLDLRDVDGGRCEARSGERGECKEVRGLDVAVENAARVETSKRGKEADGDAEEIAFMEECMAGRPKGVAAAGQKRRGVMCASNTFSDGCGEVTVRRSV
jgi:hypothetical protein